jgi:hypothetical protein
MGMGGYLFETASRSDVASGAQDNFGTTFATNLHKQWRLRAEHSETKVRARMGLTTHAIPG